MKKCGDQKERRAYGKNGLPVELHLVAVGFEKRRPAPAKLAVRVFGHLLTGWAEIAIERVERRKHVILDVGSAVRERFGARRLAALHVEQRRPQPHAGGEDLG